MNSINVLVAAGLVLTLAAGCRSRDKPKGRYDGLDGGYVIREECDMPVLGCYDRCYKREASITCIGCCRDQRFLCDTQQKHSFESCDATQ
jgi:hypothetical protein